MEMQGKEQKEVAKMVIYFSGTKIDKNFRKVPSLSRTFSTDMDDNTADRLGQLLLKTDVGSTKA